MQTVEYFESILFIGITKVCFTLTLRKLKFALLQFPKVVVALGVSV